MTDARDRLREAAGALVPVLAPTLVAWQRQEGRHHLPWQRTRDPYRVWLSEIMLQQTQVSTVLGYYERFLARFPDVAALAAAPLDDVLALWSGLGYYSRARNLHRCAQAVMSEHGGRFPESAAMLQTLPGIGRSTAAAIAAFCFDERTPILDGNVKRVLSRVLAFDGDLSMSANERALWEAAETVLPAEGQDMPAWTQGLMDLGATLCTQRKPLCLTCPWSDPCLGRRQGRPETLPVKTRKLKRSARESWCLWLEHREAVWLQQRPAQGVWAGLWTLPLFDSEEALRNAYPGELEPQVPIFHVLTHMDWQLRPLRAVLAEGEAPPPVLAAPLVAPAAQGAAATTGGAPASTAASPATSLPARWVPISDLPSLGLPAPMRKLLLGA